MTSEKTASRDHRNTITDHLPESPRARVPLSLCAAVGLIVPLILWPAPGESPHVGTGPYRLAALATPDAATVLTLEGGLVGAQNLVHLTPLQLQGSFCAAPNTCVPVDYLALPGQQFNEGGADTLVAAVSALPTDGGPVILLGHSQGAQVIYAALNRWQADPSTAPDPARLSWVSIGNPDNTFGGFQTKLGLVKQPLPADTPYTGTEVIRQYDGWADWPDDPSNMLAVLNAVAGMFVVHPNYVNVDLDDPANVRYTPALADGTPGNVTYVWVPNPVLPLVSGTGPLAPFLDSMLRPVVESAYHRPVTLPAPAAASPQTEPIPDSPAPVMEAPTVTAPRVTAPAAEDTESPPDRRTAPRTAVRHRDSSPAPAATSDRAGVHRGHRASAD